MVKALIVRQTFPTTTILDFAQRTGLGFPFRLAKKTPFANFMVAEITDKKELENQNLHGAPTRPAHCTWVHSTSSTRRGNAREWTQTKTQRPHLFTVGWSRVNKCFLQSHFFRTFLKSILLRRTQLIQYQWWTTTTQSMTEDWKPRWFNLDTSERKNKKSTPD